MASGDATIEENRAPSPIAAKVTDVAHPVAGPVEPEPADKRVSDKPPVIDAEAVEARLRAKQKLTKKLSDTGYSWIFAGVGWILVYFADMWFRLGRFAPFEPVELGLAFSFLAVGCLIPAMYIRSLKRQLTLDMEKNDLELELVSSAVKTDEQRAERLFRGNERELMRYYRLNVSETRMVLFLGIFCILASLAVVAFTLATLTYFRAEASFDTWSKSLAAGLGAVSTIMVSVVAAIYIQMYGKSADQLGRFHNRLVHTHELFLANVLASRIIDRAKQEDLLAVLAKSLAQPDPGKS
jgi:hypothetical protein